jgi:lipid-A-disaccharide synthase
MLKSAAALGPGFEFLVPVAATIEPHWLEALVRVGLRRIESHDAKVTLVDDAWAALAHARAAVVASGTATVQAALAGTPFVMVYRLAPSTWTIGRYLVDVPHYAMVNLIAGERLVAELVQNDFSPKRVLEELGKILEESPARKRMIAGLQRVRAALEGKDPAGGKAAVERAAEAVLAAIPSPHALK